MKSILVIGMSRFGHHLAKKLQKLGNELMIIDIDEERIERISTEFPDSQIGDCTDQAVIDALGVNNFDLIFVTMSDDFQSSLVVTTLLKKAGAPKVIATASQDIQSEILKKIGADEVIDPDKEISEKIAVRFNANNIADYIPLADEYGIYEIPILRDWTGKSVGEIDVRRKYKINIIAIKTNNRLRPVPGADYVFDAGDHIVVIGTSADVFKLASRV